jgi:ring-1,2-phenylacetyl-CoA epoxidase subunit PaaD
MVTEESVFDVLCTIDDPEMPVSIVDLGIVESVRIDAPDPVAVRVEIDILPTFVGCPALSLIESEIKRKLTAVRGVSGVVVNFKFAPPWTVDRISTRGREALRKVGITVPARSPDNVDQAPSCPFCGSTDVKLESSFGPTRCRMIYHCEACRHPFEHLKRVPLPTTR